MLHFYQVFGLKFSAHFNTKLLQEENALYLNIRVFVGCDTVSIGKYYYDIYDVLKHLGAFRLHCDAALFLWLLDLENEGIAISQIFGNYLTNTPQHPRRPEYLATPLWEPKMSHYAAF
jgi:hypothetical protein